MKSGTLVSDGIHERLRALYNARAGLSGKIVTVPFWAGLVRAEQFDNFYVALYELSLAGKGSLLFLDKQDDSPQINAQKACAKPVLTFEILTDTRIEYAKRGATFEETMLDEFAVADAYNLLHLIQSRIPLRTRVSQAALGCFYAEFTVFADPELVPSGQEPLSFNKRMIETSPAWQQLFNRYKIATFSTKPVPH